MPDRWLHFAGEEDVGPTVDLHKASEEELKTRKIVKAK